MGEQQPRGMLPRGMLPMVGEWGLDMIGGASLHENMREAWDVIQGWLRMGEGCGDMSRHCL